MILTTAYRRILWHAFRSESCPVCNKPKQPKWCFCRGCYFGLKRVDPRLAAALYTEILEDSDRFFESYARAKDWLQENGFADHSFTARPRSGDLFA